MSILNRNVHVLVKENYNIKHPCHLINLQKRVQAISQLLKRLVLCISLYTVPKPIVFNCYLWLQPWLSWLLEIFPFENLLQSGFCIVLSNQHSIYLISSTTNTAPLACFHCEVFLSSFCATPNVVFV